MALAGYGEQLETVGRVVRNKPTITLGANDGTSDTMEVYVRGNKAYFEIISPWHGDSESGFGATLGMELDEKSVRLLIEYLSK